jgi:hypothetical protein
MVSFKGKLEFSGESELFRGKHGEKALFQVLSEVFRAIKNSGFLQKKLYKPNGTYLSAGMTNLGSATGHWYPIRPW